MKKGIMLKTAVIVLVACLMTGGIVPAITPVTTRAQAAQTITKKKAKKIALKNAKARASKIKNYKIRLDDGREYEIKFTKGGRRYEYDIDASRGKIKSCDKKRVSLSSSEKKKSISKKKALKIACKDVGVSKSKISHLQVKKKKTGKGFCYYKVEFVYAQNSYEYEIDGYIALILDSDVDTDDDDDDDDGDDDDDD